MDKQTRRYIKLPIHLTEEQKQELEFWEMLHAKDNHEIKGIHVVLAASKMKTQKEVANTFHISQPLVIFYLRRYEQQGILGFIPRRKGWEKRNQKLQTRLDEIWLDAQMKARQAFRDAPKWPRKALEICAEDVRSEEITEAQALTAWKLLGHDDLRIAVNLTIFYGYDIV